MTALRPALLALALGGVLAGCNPPPPKTTPEQADACRARADEVFQRQNRQDVFRTDTHASGTRDAMFSSTGSPGVGVGQLSSRFARDQLYIDCLRAVAGNVGTTPDAPSATPGPAGAAPAAAAAQPAAATAPQTGGVMPRGQALPPPGLTNPSRE